MPNVTVSIDDDLKKKMGDHPEINWSEVARQAIQQKLDDLDLMEQITADSELTEKDVNELADKINQDAADRLMPE